MIRSPLVNVCLVAVLQLEKFLKIYISQGSLATCFGCSGIFNDSFIGNFPESVPVKGFGKSVENRQSY